MKPLLVSSGEPAGIGPDICLAMAKHALPIVVLGDKQVLKNRAEQLGLEVILDDYKKGTPPAIGDNHLTVLSISSPAPVLAGTLNVLNAPYVIELLTTAVERCKNNEFSALVTAPVHKAIINQAGISFTGHTEFLAQAFHIDQVVMMLICPTMKVALVTTHLPLKEVSSAITKKWLTHVVTILHHSLQQDFSIINPVIYVCGLNPHAGEGGYLGREEIEVISPVISMLQQQGMDVQGPFSADTLFTPSNIKRCDVFLAMYHDQGLPVLKFAGFGEAVNITLGLPIIRTSVDHGTALELAGTGHAESTSLLAAIKAAKKMVSSRAKAI